MKYLAYAAVAVAAAQPASAQEVKALAEARVRYEHVAQDGLPLDADAVTARVRAGVQVTQGAWNVLAEAQGTVALDDRYYDGLHGTPTRPLIGDPENVALYRAQVQYRSAPVTLTAGRQRIVLDDERFVGAAAIRQNAQSFDGVRAELLPAKGLKLDLSYIWDVRTIWGVEGNGARQQGVGGNNVFANLSYATPVGTLTGFAYLIDQDEAAVQGYRLSSQSYGVRLAGLQSLGGGAKLAYQLSHARQSDYHRNPNDYSALYWLADAAVEVRGWKIGGGYEILGADRGAALTSFQTPLGAVFKFQGWADKFTLTPPDGIRDRYASLGYGFKALGPLTALSLQAAYHRYDSDRLVRHYGNEIDLLASGRLGKTTLSMRYADYRADRLLTDTQKLWLQLDWAL